MISGLSAADDATTSTLGQPEAPHRMLRESPARCVDATVTIVPSLVPSRVEPTREKPPFTRVGGATV